ncbi:hypothetical protein H8S95_15555 [Pontibacter sp. KCTC 32443]|uniref:hypothetical protein n=1 Tax=Pontibacter TaxID=323449 RepID=UPI00164D9B7D|nr:MULTISPECIES: hypothetical protein [Pontibacter]MBC5775493.1 hypothetical protein [Pontibacter sp. KCTC 32443]
MKNFLFCLVFAILFISCKTEQLVLTPTYNKGGYTLEEYKSKALAAQGEFYVGGRIIEAHTKQPMPGVAVKLGCYFSGDDYGNYNFKTTPGTELNQLISRYVGYLDVESKPMKFQAGDSLIIDFYMAQDEKPLINCEGAFN